VRQFAINNVIEISTLKVPKRYPLVLLLLEAHSFVFCEGGGKNYCNLIDI